MRRRIMHAEESPEGTLRDLRDSKLHKRTWIRSLQRVRHRDIRFGQISRIVEPGWRALLPLRWCGRQRPRQGQCGVTNDRVGGSRVSRPLVQRIPLFAPMARYGCLSRSRCDTGTAASRWQDTRVPPFIPTRPSGRNIWTTQARHGSPTISQGHEMSLKNYGGFVYPCNVVLYVCRRSFGILLASRNKLSS